MEPAEIDRFIGELRPTPGSFLGELEDPDRRHLLADGMLRTYSAYQTLLHEADPSDYVLFIGSGWMKVTAASESGYEVLLAVRGAGDILGELSAIDGRPRGATLTALTPVEAVLVASPRFSAGLLARPTGTFALLRELVARLREADSKRLEAAAYSSAERLAAFLLTLAERYGEKRPEGTIVTIPLSQNEIAGAIGASRETVAKLLRLLRERGIVATSRRRIVIAGPEALAGLAHSL